MVARTPGFNKRAPRVDLRRPAILVDSDGSEQAISVLDVSSGGFRIEVSECPRIGEFVTIRAERGLSFPAQIRWVLGNEAGGTFLTPVDQGDWV
jgi:PilZ domain-containing protein